MKKGFDCGSCILPKATSPGPATPSGCCESPSATAGAAPSGVPATPGKPAMEKNSSKPQNSRPLAAQYCWSSVDCQLPFESHPWKAKNACFLSTCNASCLLHQQRVILTYNHSSDDIPLDHSHSVWTATNFLLHSSRILYISLSCHCFSL